MPLREQSYISSKQSQELKDLASDWSYDQQEFAQLYIEVKDIYEGLTKKLRRKDPLTLTDDQKFLVQAYKNLDTLSISETWSLDWQVGSFMMYLQILHGDTMWYEDKDFYMEAFDELGKLDAEFAATLEKFKEDFERFGDEIRLQQQHKDNPYTAVDEDWSNNIRKQTGKLERKEYKGKDKQLMRTLLEDFDSAAWEADKWTFEDITNYLDDTNMPQLMDIFASWHAKLPTGFPAELTHDNLPTLLETENYQPKWWTLGRKERRNIIKLYTAFNEYDWGLATIFWSDTTDPLTYLVTVLRSDISLAHTIQAKTLVDAADAMRGSEGSITLLRNMIWDVNYDARLINAPDPKSDEYINNYKAWEKAWKNVDTGIVMGTSLHEMMIDAEQALGMEMWEAAEWQVIKNIAGALAGYTGDTSLQDVNTPDALFQKYVDQPYLLAATHQMLLDAGDDSRLIMQYGIGNKEKWLPSYTDMIEAIAAQETVDIADDADVTALDERLSAEQHKKIDNKLSECFTNLVTTLEQQMHNDPTLNTPALASFVSSLEQDQVTYKNLWKINTLGVMVSTIKGNEGIGLWTNVNVWLNKNLEWFIQRITLSGWAFIDKEWSPALGVALSAWANHGFGKDKQHTFYYAWWVGAWWTKKWATDWFFSGLKAGPFVSSGVEFQINKGRIEGSLDAKSAQHIWVLVSASIGTAGGTLYWSRDKLKWYQQQKASIEASFSGAFKGIENLDELTSSTIFDNLKKIYPNTDHDTLQQAANNMTRILRPFADRWWYMDEAVKWNILQTISKRYALSWYNQKVEHEARGLHITQAWVGVQWVAGFLLPTAWIGLSWYKGATFSEDPESLAAMKEAQEKWYGARKVADKVTTELANRLNNLFGVLEEDQRIVVEERLNNWYGAFYIPRELISREWWNVNLHVHPAMKRFVKTMEDGSLQVHWDTPVSIIPAYRPWKVEYDLIIWSVWLEWTEQVLLSDTGIDWTTGINSFTGNPEAYEEFVKDAEFATQSAKMVEAFNGTSDETINAVKAAGFTISERTTAANEKELVLTAPDRSEKILSAEDLTWTLTIIKSADPTPIYSYEIEHNDGTETEFEIVYEIEQPPTRDPEQLSLSTWLLPILSPSVEAYINNPEMNAEMLRIRNGWSTLRGQWKNFRNLVEQNNIVAAQAILEWWKAAWKLSLDFSSLTVDDIRALDAAFSVVRLTQDKIESLNTVDGRLFEWTEYRSQIQSNYSFESDYESKWWLWTTTTWAINEDVIKWIIKWSIDYATYKREYEHELFHMMSGDAIVWNNIFYEDISSPIYKLYWLLAPNENIVNSRSWILKEKFKNEWRPELYESFNAARKSAVSPIEYRNEYSTEIRPWYAMVLWFAETWDEPLEEKFLPNPEMVAGATTEITDPGLKKYFLENLPVWSPILARLEELTGGREAAIKAIIDGSFVDINGQKVTITSTFSLWFYGKCCNETILLDELTINIPGEEPAEPVVIDTSIDTKETFCSDGVFYNSVGVESIIHKEKTTVALGWIGGDPTEQIEAKESESYTIIEDLEDYIASLPEWERELFLEQLSLGLAWEAQPWFTFTIDWIERTVDGWDLGNWSVVFSDTFTDPNVTTMRVINTNTGQVFPAETIFGPYDQMMNAIQNASVRQLAYLDRVNNDNVNHMWGSWTKTRRSAESVDDNFEAPPMIDRSVLDDDFISAADIEYSIDQQNESIDNLFTTFPEYKNYIRWLAEDFDSSDNVPSELERDIDMLGSIAADWTSRVWNSIVYNINRSPNELFVVKKLPSWNLVAVLVSDVDIKRSWEFTTESLVSLLR